MSADKSETAFAAWMDKIDACLIRKCGIGSADLPDFCYRDYFDDGESPSAVARMVLREAMADMGL